MINNVFKYNPLVTIIIPVYNGESYLEDAINSAISQTYNKIEIIVISDGSTDSSDDIAKSYGDRIRFIRKENGGVSSVLNLAIAEMKGEWLSWLSHDDIYCPDKIYDQIKKLNEIIDENPSVDIEKYVICCANDRINAKGESVKRKIKYGKDCGSPIETLVSQIKRYTIGGCCILATRSAYLFEHGFNEDNRTCSDAEMWYKLMLDGYTFRFIDRPLVHSRQHNGMVSVTKRDLCVAEGRKLHDYIFNEAIETGLSEKNRYNLLCALSARNYYKVAKKNLKAAKISFFHKIAFYIKSACFAIKNLTLTVLRFVYRKIKY